VTATLSSYWTTWTSAPTISSSTPASTQPSSQSIDPAPTTSSSSWRWPWQNTEETDQLVAPTTTTTASSASSWMTSWTGLTGSDDPLLCGLSMQQRLGLFFLCLFGGIVMLMLSFSFLSLLILGYTAKFTMSYALANIMFLMSSSFLTGPTAQLSTMFAANRALISATYLLSLAALLYVAYQMPVFYILIPLIILQVVCLIAYISSYLPFGVPMMKRLFGFFVSSVKRSC